MSGDGIRASGRPPGQLAKRWLKALDNLDERLRGRARRGRTLARSGRVQSLDIAPGTVYADVEDGGELHRPTLRVRTYDEEEWRAILRVLSQRLDRLAALMEGDVDVSFLETLDASGVTLFPTPEELDGDCDCGDYAVPCAHGAAVHHLLAEALEGEPLLLFALRGRPREQLLAEFRRAWGDTSAAPSSGLLPREETPPPGDWFASPTQPPTMVFRFSPQPRAPGLLELGPLAGDGDILRTLGPLYEAGAEAAREMALADVPTGAPRRRTARSLNLQGDQIPQSLEPQPPAPRPPEPPAAAEPEEEEADLGEQLVDVLAEAEDGMSTRQLADALGVRIEKIRQELSELEEFGVVARTGSSRATRWWLG